MSCYFIYKKSTVETEEPKIKKLTSLRRSKDEDEQFNLFRVSPEFRNYVAKYLSSLMDKILKERLETNNYDNYIKPKRRKSRIRLLRDSPHFISLKTKEITQIKKKNESDDEVDVFDKCRAVAVNPDDILSQKETKYWSTRSKAPVFSYCKTDEGLVLK